MRVADEDKQMSSEELKKLIIKNKDLRWDSSFNLKAKLKDIDIRKLRRFCKTAGITFTNGIDILESLNLISNTRLTNAAVILFAKKPQTFFPNSILSCAVFATDKTATILDQKIFDGDIFHLLDEAEKYIMQNIHIGMDVKGLYRDDIPEINPEALRESLINAFLHRDYYEPDFISIGVFRDRVEIKNPGYIFGGLTIKEIISRHISKRRNEIIADIFNRIHLGERKGRGISLIIEKEPDTRFEQIAGIFITTFKRKENLFRQNGGINGGIKILLTTIENHPGLRVPNLSKSLNKPVRTIERQINELKKQNKIEYKGSLKTGGYYVKKRQ